MRSVSFSMMGFPVEIQPSFFIVMGVVLLFGLRFQQGMLALAITVAVVLGSTLLHELGHALASRWFGVPVGGIRIQGLGGQVFHGRCSPGQQVAISLAGPLAGLLAAAMALVLLPWMRHPVLQHVASVSLVVNGAWSLFNLLPMLPLDGGTALRAGLRLRFESTLALQVTVAVGLIVGGGLSIAAWMGGWSIVAIAIAFFTVGNLQMLWQVTAEP